MDRSQNGLASHTVNRLTSQRLQKDGMDTNQLHNALKDLPGFRGVFALNHLPKENHETPALYVENTQPSCKQGEHWVAIYFPPIGLPEFFDSFARKAFAPELRRLLGNVYRHNRLFLQSPISDTCGHHVIYYARERSKGIPFESINYQRKLEDNDFMVKNYVKMLPSV